MRETLPTVTVPELPNDGPTFYATIIQMAGYFNTTGIAQEDKGEQHYIKLMLPGRSHWTPQVLLKTFFSHMVRVSLGKYVISIFNFFIAQLINKTNQFNFTTRRKMRLKSLV